MRPKVALTTALNARDGQDHGRVEIWDTYLRWLERVGLAAMLVTPAHSRDSIASLMADCDGLVLSGGGDMDPARWGAHPLPGLDDVSPERDAMEYAALDEAIARDLPVLGICRGCQVVNVYFGGTLYQDLPTQRPGGVEHRQSAGWDRTQHEVQVAPGSKLAAVLGVDAVRVNSFHHQAVRAIAPGLVATATVDGLVEALESPQHTWLVAVQWHPERHGAVPDTDPSIKLLRAFRDAVDARRAGR
ncbi:MAG: gamma-glutamyl-gamma-aminobutyrate hydrolase family protein [Gemmatimonadota bacterium]|jgi:putative glutamine amidotransferase